MCGLSCPMTGTNMPAHTKPTRQSIVKTKSQITVVQESGFYIWKRTNPSFWILGEIKEKNSVRAFAASVISKFTLLRKCFLARSVLYSKQLIGQVLLLGTQLWTSFWKILNFHACQHIGLKRQFVMLRDDYPEMHWNNGKKREKNKRCKNMRG